MAVSVGRKPRMGGHCTEQMSVRCCLGRWAGSKSKRTPNVGSAVHRRGRMHVSLELKKHTHTKGKVAVRSGGRWVLWRSFWWHFSPSDKLGLAKTQAVSIMRSYLGVWEEKVVEVICGLDVGSTRWWRKETVIPRDLSWTTWRIRMGREQGRQQQKVLLSWLRLSCWWDAQMAVCSDNKVASI